MSSIKFKPTFLYIKQHSITGLLYFGKTVQNPEKYIGSGKYWNNHIGRHGVEHVINLWYCLFFDKEECVKFALDFSKEYDIVESHEWANLCEENAISGSNGWGHLKGKRAVIDKVGVHMIVDDTDPRVLSGEVVGVFTGRCAYKDKEGNVYNVRTDDSRVLSGEFVGVVTGMANVKDVHGNRFQVAVDDPRVLSGEFVGVTKGDKSITVFDIELNKALRIKVEEFWKNKEKYHTIYRAKKLGLWRGEG